jgi:hypothetical protein
VGTAREITEEMIRNWSKISLRNLEVESEVCWWNTWGEAYGPRFGNRGYNGP